MTEKKNFLIFARVGKKSLHRNWLAGDGERNWDLQLSQYDDDPAIGEGGDLPLSIDKGTKWDSIYRYLEANPGILDAYKYIMFMDDDLDISTQDLNRFFEICDEHDLLVAQPSLQRDSYFCYPILLQCPSMKLRYSNFVECMSPALRTDYLKEFRPRMAGSKSGWGLDHIWAVSMDSPPFKSAIVDEVSIQHTRPHNTAGGIRSAYMSGAVSPADELRAIKQTYNDVPTRMLVYGAHSRNGAQVSEMAARLRNGIYLMLNLPRFKNKRYAFRGGLGMLLRAFTAIGYLPKQITRASAPTGALDRVNRQNAEH